MAVNICGLYVMESRKEYLPIVNIKAHTTIIATTSRTKLTQTYINPSDNRDIQELQYTFPLYYGVSVASFNCRIGNQIIVGQVKEREKARNVFKQVVARGEKAALLEQLLDASDVFTATVGNVPAGAMIIVEITYMGECKHDAEVDGIRFTIPTTIMPRYGDYPVGLIKGNHIESASEGRIQITVDVIMAQESVIQQIQSPSHPIAVSLGTTSLAPGANPTMSKASATLSLGSVELNKDFIVQVLAAGAGVPTAILETHPTIPNQRALMVTLVPRFALPPEKPEVVFMCDRSGSMDGSNITLARSAMKVFLKRLPVGVKFNVCSFGSTPSFLWDKSQTNTQATLEEALKHVDTIDADMGGTEMFEAIEETLDQRCKDIPLEVLLLTDGEIWEQQRLFSYLNKQVIESQAPIRIFTLGIGNGVSHALIEGIAKAGNGFSQSVGEGERMENKVVRMLEGALSPHVMDYTLEVKYADEHWKVDMDDDDFVMVERVTDSLNIKLGLTDNQEAKFEFESARHEQEQEQELTSLIGSSANANSGEEKYNDLPLVTPPKLLQVPNIIPPLYAFNRTNVYLLMGPECSQMTPKSVVLRGTSRHGPLEIEIPIQVLDTPGETIHQLAAKTAIAELEQGRGWITQAKDEYGALIQSKFSSLFPQMVKRETVRLGVQFQVQGKWCSFVAVESQQEGEKEKEVVRIAVETTTAAQGTEETVIAERLPKAEVNESVIVKESGSVSQSTAPKRASWFHRLVAAAAADKGGHVASNDAGVDALNVGVVAAGARVATAGAPAFGALHKVDGVWKRTVQVLTTHKAHVDEICPIHKTSYVYYDEDVYDAILVDKITGVKHVNQLLYDCETHEYYVYYRWSDTEYTLSMPYKTIEEAKNAFQLNYKEKFNVDWSERETAVSDRYTYDVKTHETFEEVEEVEEVVDETEAATIVQRKESAFLDDNALRKQKVKILIQDDIAIEHVQEKGFQADEEVTSNEPVIAGSEEDNTVRVDATIEETVETTTVTDDDVKEIAVTTETGVVAEPARTHGTSWFPRVMTGTEAAARGVGSAAAGAAGAAGTLVSGAESAVHGVGHTAEAVALGAGIVAAGAGVAAAGALHKVDGIGKRTVRVLATRKARVDELCPIHKTSYVYYDEDVYDAVLVDKITGVKHVNQLLYDCETHEYYVYYRWSDTEYTLSMPYKTIEEAKNAFQLNYKEKFNVDWSERETAVSDRYTYDVKTHETFEEVEEIEEIEEVVDETEVTAIIEREQ